MQTVNGHDYDIDTLLNPSRIHPQTGMRVAESLVADLLAEARGRPSLPSVPPGVGVRTYLAQPAAPEPIALAGLELHVRADGASVDWSIQQPGGEPWSGTFEVPAERLSEIGTAIAAGNDAVAAAVDATLDLALAKAAELWGRPVTVQLPEA